MAKTQTQKKQPKSKENLNQLSTSINVRVCVSLCTTVASVQHRTVLTIFPLILWAVILAQMLSTGRQEEFGRLATTLITSTELLHVQSSLY